MFWLPSPREKRTDANSVPSSRLALHLRFFLSAAGVVYEAVLVLGLESSCDETAAAIVEDGRRLRSNVVASQVDLHARYGGVVPELASRAHVHNVMPVIDEALEKADVTLPDIDVIAVTQGPGLVGALLVTVEAAKALGYVLDKPVVGVHHLQGHMSAMWLEPEAPPFPHIALIVSGGHTSLIYAHDHGAYEVLGTTRDDAAGEAFDKVAKLLGLPYPGGVAIDRLSESGDAAAIRFPKAMTAADTKDDFSFSGLKTAALNHVREQYARDGAAIEGQALADMCASFQAAVVEQLVRKTRKVAWRKKLGHVLVCGGVAANRCLRRELGMAGSEYEFRVYAPPIKYCTDNAAMIAAAGYHVYRQSAQASRPSVAIAELQARSDLALPAPTP